MDDKVFYPYQKQEYPIAVKGEGIYLWDETGKRYVDASSGPVACIIGHGVPEIRVAAEEQMKKLEFAHRFRFTNEPTIKLAEMIAESTPGDLNKILFVSGGSEATESAMKMAHAYFVEKGIHTKYKVIGRRMSYHGNTLGSLSMGGHVNRKKIYAPMVADFPHVAPPNCYHCPFGKSPDTCCVDCALDFETAIINEGPENVSAIIVEPISGAGLAAITPDDRYMAKLREICDKYNVLMIADEVMTGMGRTGKTWAMEHWGVVPDMITMAKGVSGGYIPIGAVAVKEEIYDTFKQGSGGFTHGHTYGSHPVCTAVGIAVLDYVRENNLVENSALMGDYLREQLEAIAKENPFIGEIRGKGLMLGLEFVQNKETREPFDPALGLTDKIANKAFEKGLLIYGAGKCIDGTKGDAIMIAPPLTVTKEEVDDIVNMFKCVLDDVFAKF